MLELSLGSILFLLHQLVGQRRLCLRQDWHAFGRFGEVCGILDREIGQTLAGAVVVAGCFGSLQAAEAPHALWYVHWTPQSKR